MPLINGQKMACEPCIRGHRSTKCTHANERLMIPVRKPGRPLSSCPHPPNRNCGCSGVTAAIPRKQKCHCGSNGSESPFNAAPSGTVPANAETFSPSRTIFRVQKQVRSAPSRMQSTDTSAIERMDPTQLNILTPYTFTPSRYPIPGPELTNIPGSSSNLASDSRHGDFSSPIQYSLPSTGPHASISGLNSVVVPPSVVTSPIFCSSATSPSNGDNGCGCAVPLKGAHNGLTESSPVPSSKPSDQAPRNTSGCCSRSQGSIETPVRPIQTASHSTIPQFTQSLNLFPQYFTSQSTLYTYPPLYGTYLHPLQPEEWRQTIASANHDHGLAPAPSQASSPESFQNPTETLGTFHSCSCGDSCQCVGCAAHPYNEATQKYVRSAWDSMADTVNGPVSEAYSSTSIVDVMKSEKPAQLTEGGSPPSAQTPSDTASSDEPALSASDFFFVNYPFVDDACAGDTLSCPCGDDCQCLGCSLHSSNETPG